MILAVDSGDGELLYPFVFSYVLLNITSEEVGIAEARRELSARERAFRRLTLRDPHRPGARNVCYSPDGISHAWATRFA